MGHTDCTTASTMTPLPCGPSTGRLRNAVPITVSRLPISVPMLTWAVTPPCIPMITEPAVDSQCGQIPFQIGRTHHVQDQIGARAVGGPVHPFDEVVGAVVDEHLRAKPGAQLKLCRRPGGHGDPCPEHLGDLNRVGADTARTAVQQRRFAGRQAGPHHQVGPDRARHLRQRRRIRHGDTGRDRHHLGGRRGNELGVAAAGQQAPPLVPQSEIRHFVADVRNHPDTSGPRIWLAPGGAGTCRPPATGRRDSPRRPAPDEHLTRAGRHPVLPATPIGPNRDDGAHNPPLLRGDTTSARAERSFTISAWVGSLGTKKSAVMPGLDVAEMQAWENFLDAALRIYGSLNRTLSDSHKLTLVDVRLLDILDKSETGSTRMGDLAEQLPHSPAG